MVTNVFLGFRIINDFITSLNTNRNHACYIIFYNRKKIIYRLTVCFFLHFHKLCF